MSWLPLQRRTVLAAGLATGLPVRASKPRVLTVAAFPLIDKIVEAALPQWRQLHPDVDLKVLSRPMPITTRR